jgi:hypothetical protein
VVKSALAEEVFIAALKVKTTGAEGETLVAPFSGLLLTVVLCAHPASELVNRTSVNINFGFGFMVSF